MLNHAQSSPYHAPPVGSFRDRLNHFRLSVAYRAYRLTLSRYADISPDATIADMGCGPGYLLNLLRDWYPQAVLLGFDYDLALLDEAKARVTSPIHPSLIQANAERLPLGNATIDLVVTLHMLEHLHDPESFIAEAKRVLSPGGWLLLATPNPKGLGAHIMQAKWAGFREDHIALKSPEEWRTLLMLSGFEPLVQRTTGLTGLPAFRKLPLSLLNWGALALFGSFPWRHGEAYVAVWRKAPG